MEAITTNQLVNTISVLLWYNKYLEKRIRDLQEMKAAGSFERLVLSTVAKWYGVSTSDIKSKSRRREHVVPRHTVCSIMKSYSQYTLQQIGVMIGNRDHSTVMNSLHAHDNLLFTEPSYKRLYDLIVSEIDSAIGGGR
jgi:chromosomal replication initiation ATPase DnaA